MSELRIRESRRDDLPVVLDLLRQAGLPEDIEPHFESFLVAEDGGLIGAVGLESFGSRALLRSLVVVPARRGIGVGGRLAREVIERAEARGATEIFLLTLDAAGFCERFGFRTVARDEPPPEIRETREFRELCPASAGLMKVGSG